MDTYGGDDFDSLTLHKYLYCSADPVDNYDPSGHDGTLMDEEAAMAISNILDQVEIESANYVMMEIMNGKSLDEAVKSATYQKIFNLGLPLAISSVVNFGSKFLRFAKDIELLDKSGEEINEIEDIEEDAERERKAETINKLFSEEEIENLKTTVIKEGQMLKDEGLTNKQLGSAIAGVYDKITGMIYTAINDMKGAIPSELSPIIEERIENITEDVLNSYTYTIGTGSHAEAYALNKALLANLNAIIDDLLVYVNRTLSVSKPITEIPFQTCPHCKYKLDRFHILSNT